MPIIIRGGGGMIGVIFLYTGRGVFRGGGGGGGFYAAVYRNYI